ncbi:MAG: hypothetical protein HQL15_00305 [Candidatus Omnitrophica bacterium]|nr:hypothetical protein [Candidatus Omnitrophota bacterium]
MNFLIPLHPKLVHFPIALFMTALVFEILGRVFKKNLLSEASFLIYCFAAVLTPVIVYSGLLEQTRIHLNHPILTQHKNFAFLTMWIALISLPILWGLRKISDKTFRNFYFLLVSVLTLTVTMAGYYGGKMVYEYSVGVGS